MEQLKRWEDALELRGRKCQRDGQHESEQLKRWEDALAERQKVAKGQSA
jgi:hypothetical protein